MFIFRGQRIDNKEWIEGYYVFNPKWEHLIFEKSWLLKHGVMGAGVPIVPETLSISTGQLDKNKVEIFGSFEVDGKMSNGGDRVKFKNCSPETHNVIFENGAFQYNPIGLCSSEYFDNVEDGELIGKQCDETDK
jgi:hypothetical protein